MLQRNLPSFGYAIAGNERKLYLDESDFGNKPEQLVVQPQLLYSGTPVRHIVGG